MAAGLLITETWRYYSVQALLWGWIGIPAAAAALGARFWPRVRDLWRRYSRVSPKFNLVCPLGQSFGWVRRRISTLQSGRALCELCMSAAGLGATQRKLLAVLHIFTGCIRKVGRRSRVLGNLDSPTVPRWCHTLDVIQIL